MPIVLPGQPHFDAHAAMQFPPFQLRRAQAGPAKLVGRTEKEMVIAAAKDKVEKRAMLLRIYVTMK